ncbi:hypothetical protein [Alteromonas flava]|uniref:hypothetical protein n=1 Tax=Alteromonas flava TaxID=2048003 RepID=UPI001F0C128E|nr:hypothetical protein [Alteromonas flava]
MHDESPDEQGKISTAEYRKMSGRDRRERPRTEDRIYRLALGLNLLCWLGLVGALVLFHYARPELVTGVQEYLGLTVREDWSAELVSWLNWLLQLCLLLSLLSVWLGQRRSRRATDSIGISFIVLILIVVISFITLQITVLPAL